MDFFFYHPLIIYYINLIKYLGPTHSGRNALPLKPFSSSAYEIPIRIFATTIKIRANLKLHLESLPNFGI